MFSVVSATPAINCSPESTPQALFFTGIVDTGDKFIVSVVITSNNFSPVSLILAINLSPESLSPVIIVQRCQRHR